ncbi:MAG TPA: hypothetical protein VN645_09925 [Steroidobacteraceae bacterium]|nr:hypothetical protein [Steroidobacteraceae bacterium]
MDGGRRFQLGAVTLICCALLGPSLTAADLAQESQLRAEGLWTGELQQSGKDQRIQVRLHRDGDLLTGTLNLIDQGARDLKLDAVSVTEDVLSFQVYALDGRFAGSFSSSGDEIRGTWTQASKSRPLRLFRARDPDRAKP